MTATPTQTATPYEITHAGHLVALIIPHGFTQPGVNFFTPAAFPQQLASQQLPAGHAIAAHTHNPVPREVTRTQEVLILRKGRLRVDFYDEGQTYLKSAILEAGDIIFLAAGGHGFEVLEEVEMVEVKQGPFAGEDDKRRFAGVKPDQIRLVPWNS